MTDSKLPETPTRPRDLTPAQQVQEGIFCAANLLKLGLLAYPKEAR
jgi:hypothetical protein